MSLSSSFIVALLLISTPDRPTDIIPETTVKSYSTFKGNEEWKLFEVLLKNANHEKRVRHLLGRTGKISFWNTGSDNSISYFCSNNDIPWFYMSSDDYEKSFIPIDMAIKNKLSCLVRITDLNIHGDEITPSLALIVNINHRFLTIVHPNLMKEENINLEDFYNIWTGDLFMIYPDQKTRDLIIYRQPI